MVQFIRVTQEDFELKVDQSLQDDTAKVFVVFFGSETPATGQSWCPDCVVAEPRIRQALIDVPNAVLIEAPVGLRDEWRKGDHPYRKKYNVPALPTLYKWSKAGPGAQLVEEDAADINKLASFVQA